MASGSRSAVRGGARLPRRAAALCLAALLALAAAACRSERGFSRALDALDEDLRENRAGALDSDFARACRRASSAADWLSILKRARASEAAGDSGRFLELARKAVKAKPASEPVAAAAALAMARGGDPNAALGLFRTVLPPESYPSVWAEAFLESARRGSLAAAGPSPEDFARLAEASGEARCYAGAATLSLVAGDASAAARWAERAEAGGAALPAALLWDCGLYARLASRLDAGADAVELAIMGDAAWLMGDPGLAGERWEAAIAAAPTASWKTYVKLAASSGDPDRARSYWRRLRAAFLEGARPDAEAAVAYASALYAAGRDGEALAALAPFSGNAAADGLALRIASSSWPDGRLSAEAFRLAERGPAQASAYALASLARRGLVDDLLALYDSAESRGLQYPDRWFFSAAAAAARGDYPACVAAVDASGPAASSPEAWLARGLALGAMGEPSQAAAAFRAAAAAFAEPASRCAALKLLGAALGGLGDVPGAASAYRAAASADPADSEAALLARRAGAP